MIKCACHPHTVHRRSSFVSVFGFFLYYNIIMVSSSAADLHKTAPMPIDGACSHCAVGGVGSK